MAALHRVTVHEHASFMPTHCNTTHKIPRAQLHFQRLKSHFNVNADTKISPTHLTETERPHKFSPFAFAQGLPSFPTGEEHEHEHEHDIALKLPHLHQMLQLLRKKQGSNNEEEGERRRGEGLGNVYLVGTGPGDPELVTLKALRVMQTADLVLYDRLVSTDILDMVHSGATLLYVGKTAGYHSRTQDEIHQLLLSFAQAGATVVRLKGGDPLVFGRGGEEMDFLQQQGIEVKVVPGITAASGIAAELGIPLTHRGVANSVRFLTGHSKKGGTDPLFVVKHAADPESTLVIYMGLATLSALADKLISSGLTPETPAAAVERGTTSQQRMVFAELQNLPDEVIDAHLVSPTLIIIGKVVALSSYWPTNSSKRKQEKNVGTSEVYEAV